MYGIKSSAVRGKNAVDLVKLASYRTSTNPLSLSVTPSTPESPATIAVADLMKSLSVLEVIPPGSSRSEYRLREVGRHFATLWSSATAATGPNEWVVADMEGNLAMLRRNAGGVTFDDKKRLEVIGELRLGEVVNKIVSIVPPTSGPPASSGKGKERARTLSTQANPLSDQTASGAKDIPMRSGSIIQPKAFIATVEGAIYMLGSINAPYVNALLLLQSALANKVRAPGYMPWSKYRAWKTEVRESEEPFRFVDGEMVEQGLLSLSDSELEIVLRDGGLMEDALKVTVEEARMWGEELRRLY